MLEVTILVRLEAVAVDHDGHRVFIVVCRFGRVSAPLLRHILRWVFDSLWRLCRLRFRNDEDEWSAVRRARVVLGAAGLLRRAPGLAAAAVHRPGLRTVIVAGPGLF